MKLRRHHFLFLFILASQGCVDEIQLKTETTFESVFVVEATITDELKYQEIKLSKAYELGSDVPLFESNANVVVVDENNVEYEFNESESGTYKSNMEFAAQPNIKYQLHIETINGNKYLSSEVQLTKNAVIDNLYFERGNNENGVEGVSAFVDTYDSTGESKYYRFEFEESYKIISPLYVSDDLVDRTAEFIEQNGSDVPAPVFDPRFVLVPRPIEEQTCYQTNISKDIIISNTNEFSEDRLDHFRVRFIGSEDYIISHRYSILVNMYVQSLESYSFYSKLKEFSKSESLLSQVQPGFFEGNLVSTTSSNEKIIGLFDVSSIDTKRVYFNYSDLYPNQSLPPYAISCNTKAPSELSITPLPCPILLACYLESGEWKYVDENSDYDPTDPDKGFFLLAPRACGDCTVYGNSIPPMWWQD